MKLSALSVGPSWEMGLPSESERTLRVVSNCKNFPSLNSFQFLELRVMFLSEERFLGQGEGD